LERGSTHCLWQQNKVAQEYKRLGVGNAFYYPDSVVKNDSEEYELADRICVPSHYVAKSFELHGVDSQKLFINAYGVDFNFWSQDKLPQESNGKTTFLWVAGLCIRKGFPVLLEAWEKAQISDAELICIGSLDSVIEDLIKQAPSSVKIFGYQSHTEIRKIMSRATAYILPSFEEGMARSVLEALAAALPSIITEETGATDVLKAGEDTWVVPSGDVDALVEALREVVAAPEEAELRGIRAQQSVKDYTWQAYGDRAASHLRTTLKAA